MSVKKHIPNFITTCNLLCGCASLVLVSKGEMIWGAYFIFFALFFDFMDGLAARALKVTSEIGKQLDSLADMVTFGVAPGFLMYSIMDKAAESVVLWPMNIAVESAWLPNIGEEPEYWWYLKTILPLLAFAIPVFAALRLAKFNVDESQSKEFRGLASPAAAIFFTGFAIYYIEQLQLNTEGIGTWGLKKTMFEGPDVELFLIGTAAISVVMGAMMVMNFRMFSFKFENMGWKGNEVRYLFIGVVALSISGALLINNLFVAGPIIILLYIVISIINNLFRKKDEIQS